jgi:hypothetical protein
VCLPIPPIERKIKNGQGGRIRTCDLLAPNQTE